MDKNKKMKDAFGISDWYVEGGYSLDIQRNEGRGEKEVKTKELRKEEAKKVGRKMKEEIKRVKEENKRSKDERIRENNQSRAGEEDLCNNNERNCVVGEETMSVSISEETAG